MIKKIYVPLMAFLSLGNISCYRDHFTTPTDSINNTATDYEVNDFIWKAMNSWYYWQPNVPNLADNLPTNKTAYNNLLNGKTPDQLFYHHLLYNYGQNNGDRFSWIENNNEIVQATKSAEAKKSTGMDFLLYPKTKGDISYVGLINYVAEASAAANAGLKRGDVITKVNGKALSQNNYLELFNDSFSITIAKTTELTSEGIVTTDDKTLNITKTLFDENPIAHYQLYKEGGRNIAYLVYNGFESDYNDELNATFAKMKADGVDDLILDLRYNGGGSVESAEALAQMITGQFTGQDYIYFDFNDKHNNEDVFDKLKKDVTIYTTKNGVPTKVRTEAVNSLNLTRVYILQSQGTASASELTINCLKKYINVITIGSESVGKFMGSITLYDSPNNDWESYENRNKKHNWKIQPLVFTYYNKDKDENPKEGGLKPFIEVNPYDYFNTIKEFGNLSDPALSRAYNLITNTIRTTNSISKSNYKSYKTFSSKAIISKSQLDNSNKLYIEDFNSFKKRK